MSNSTGPTIIPIESHHLPGGSTRFEGGAHDANTSFFVVKAPTGRGAARHRHPYPEIFVILDGEIEVKVNETPDTVRKLVTISSPFNNDEGFRLENLEGSRSVTAEALAGSPLEAGQQAVNPDMSRWPGVVEKVAEMNRTWSGWAPADIQAIAAPTLNIVGDADGIRIDHTLEMLRLRGGDVNGDFAGVPASQMAVVPGATHFSIITRVDLLTLLIVPYLQQDHKYP